ncbi:hypothetical protein SNE40_019258 [Patella caerulea]|uniref:Fibrinogen C-terminal domain-containing protein n=1 Tax=Patella caerulea TaxID=87958 RepID=A0AAN8JA92_PATCE
MGISIRVFLDLLPFVVAVSTSQDSKFIQTKVIEESPDCMNNDYNGFILQKPKLSLIDCARFCSNHENCTRFMFDKEDHICSLYESGENCFTSEDLSKKVSFRLTSTCDSVNCTRCSIGYYGDQCQYIIKDCTDGIQMGVVPLKKSLMSFIQPLANGPVLEVKCVFDWGGLTFIQSRETICMETDFNRTWHDYSSGFGNRHGNYWIGLENIYDIIQNHPNWTVIVAMAHGRGINLVHGYYSGFNITNAEDDYRITIEQYSARSYDPSGDALINGTYSINGRPFSTYDHDISNNSCPARFGGGWWYVDQPFCCRANVNGRRPDSGLPFEATWHWLDNQGNKSDYRRIQLYLMRGNIIYT